MQFPLWLHVGPLTLHPHPVFEGAAYLIGYRFYVWQRRSRGDPLPTIRRLTVVAAAVIGGAVGSKALALLDDPAETLHRIRIATGDLYALPLVVAIAIGRVGCFLTGLPDQTHGLPTTLPWGIDFGDGVPRHPTQLYEIVFLVALGVAVLVRQRRPHVEGDCFKLFMIGYLLWRLAVEAIKPGVTILGLTAIQWACIAGLLHYARYVPRVFGGRGEEAVWQPR